ncbi:MAG: cytochrome c3 family protein [Chitinivibrionales bacterium]|nr:cytochrome c3 family protein [Chitinivibrionales bacterium]
MRSEPLIIFCAFSLAFGAAGAPDTLKFSHKTHLQDIGAQCADCHVSLSDKGKPAKAPIVAEEACKKCHDNKTASFECKICHTNSENVKPPAPRQLKTLFSHAQHLDSSKTCTPCHTGLEAAAKATKKNFPLMATCRTCHDNRKAPGACAVCHKDLSAIKPATHDGQWLYRGGHGDQARLPMAQCVTCHENSYCNRCHQGNTPVKIHSPGYEFEHGFDVKRKELDCTVCHQTARFCSRCHEGKR